MNKFKEAAIKAEVLEDVYKDCEDKINWTKERQEENVKVAQDPEESEWMRNEMVKQIEEYKVKIAILEDIQEMLEKELKR